MNFIRIHLGTFFGSSCGLGEEVHVEAVVAVACWRGVPSLMRQGRLKQIPLTGDGSTKIRQLVSKVINCFDYTIPSWSELDSKYMVERYSFWRLFLI